MKNKTYNRMTKKRPLRGFKLFKQKYLTKQRLYAVLAKFHLVREVKDFPSEPYTKNDTLNKVNTLDDRVITDRGKFLLSYRAIGLTHTNNWWYESLFKKKRLYTIKEDISYYLSVEVHADCESFLVKVNPYTESFVFRGNPYITVPKVFDITHPLEEGEASVERLKCDFFNARLATAVSMVVYSEEEIEDMVRNLVNVATTRLHDYIEGNPAEINKRIVGVEFDGAFHTPEGKPLMPNCICRRCGRPVFESSTEGYKAQCLFCDEDIYGFEYITVDPAQYEEIYNFNKYLLYHRLYR